MLNSRQRGLFSYLVIIMMFKLCHSINYSPNSMHIIYDPSGDEQALKAIATSFSHVNFKNFTLFHLIPRDGKTSLFVVSNQDTIIELNVENMKIVNFYKADFCLNVPKYQCEDRVAVKVLADLSLFHRQMLWFCYIPLHSSPIDTIGHCLIPKNKVIPDDIQWTKRGFTSTNHSDDTFVVKTNLHIFIGSNQENALAIFRTKLPDNNGKMNSDADLVTPKAEFYFEKNSRFLEAFSTQYEVFYVVQEPITFKVNGLSECVSNTDQKVTINTRLIRLCKDDPGTIDNDNERNFGTAAKAEIVCPVGVDAEQYVYTRSISASWSGSALYVLFDSQKNSPSGKVICVYDEFSMSKAFNSEMIPPRIFATVDKVSHKLNPPIENLCQKLTQNSLNETEKSEASSLSVNGLYRSKSVLPITTVPVMTLVDSNYKKLTTFKMNTRDQATILVLIADNFLRIVVHLDNNKICHLKDLRFEPNEIIYNVQGNQLQRRSFIHVSTNQRVHQLDLSKCEEFEDKLSCLTKAPSICGWDSRQKRCTTITEDVDTQLWQRSDCKRTISIDDLWTLPEQCTMKNGEETLTCLCRYCVRDTWCADGQRAEITNCTGTANTYNNWSSWTECYHTSLYQKRTRNCKTSKCIGKSVDYRKCQNSLRSDDISISVTTTNWTDWYKTENDYHKISFRAKCPRNPSLPPIIEKRQKFCKESCFDSSLGWTQWSSCKDKNVQFRLLNCSSFDDCPYSRTEVRSCHTLVRRLSSASGTKTNSYSIIHIALAVCITSFVWLIILVLLIRYNPFYQRKSKTRSLLSTSLLQRTIPESLYHPYQPETQKSIFSETSNEYISSGIPSVHWNHDITVTSFTGTIQSDQTTYSSKDSVAFV